MPDPSRALDAQKVYERIKMIKNERKFVMGGYRKDRHGVCALLLLLLLVVSLLAACAGTQFSPAEEKQMLKNRIESVNVEKCDSVAECLVRWKFPSGFDKAKLLEVEALIHRNYYESVSTSEMARIAADCFVNVFYDTVSFSDKTAYTDSLIQCMVFALGDDYAIYRTAAQYEDYSGQMSGSYGGIGMTVRKDYEKGTVTVIRLIGDAPAEAAGIQIGDQIYSVEGTLVTMETIDSAFEKMQGEVGTAAHFEVLRDGEIIPFAIVRQNLDNMTVSTKILDGNIAYISVSSFKGTTFKYFKKAVDEAILAGAVGFIFDMRDNPGGYLSSVMDTLDYLVPADTELLSVGTAKDTPSAYLAENPHFITLPSVVLCNEGTASAGELFTAALRDYNDMGILSATVVGTSRATFGKGIMQGSFHLKDGSVVTMTTALYNPPCGINYHGEGVLPDVICDEAEVLDVACAELLKLLNK